MSPRANVGRIVSLGSRANQLASCNTNDQLVRGQRPLENDIPLTRGVAPRERVRTLSPAKSVNLSLWLSLLLPAFGTIVTGVFTPQTAIFLFAANWRCGSRRQSDDLAPDVNLNTGVEHAPDHVKFLLGARDRRPRDRASLVAVPPDALPAPGPKPFPDLPPAGNHLDALR